MDSPLIKIENLWFSYDGPYSGHGRQVLRDVNLTIEQGDFACIVGPNGGGKTTLLKILMGLLEPQKGSVTVFGQPPAQVSHRLGYLQQNPRFDPVFPVSVMDVVLMGRLKRGIAPGFYSQADKQSAERSLEEVGLYHRRKASFSSLSGGQRQRALIARVLATEPEALLLDEPTSYLDLHAEQELYLLLSELNRRLTVIMVSHDLFIVSGFVNKVICVKGTVKVHPTEEVSEELVGELYGGEVRMVKHTEHKLEKGLE
ncbi:MAG: ABC transporter ATP-binding protein [Deltaproteobacteria bacterium]|nr:ABC transporter ATP-binding protein [Deltaproteobacteria bacterium]